MKREEAGPETKITTEKGNPLAEHYATPLLPP